VALGVEVHREETLIGIEVCLAGVPGGELVDPVGGWLVVVVVGLPALDGIDRRVLVHWRAILAREGPFDGVGIAVGLGVA
jgi:hypothetical protein